MVIVKYPTIKYAGIGNNTGLDDMSNNIAGVNTPKTNPAGIQGWEKIVGDINGAYSQIAVNSDNINLKVSKNDVINQINISTEGIGIQGKHIEIDGDTTVHGTFSITSIGDAGDLATKNRTDLQYEDGADVTQQQLDLGASIDKAKANGTTLINGGYIDTTLIHASELIVGGIENQGDLATKDRNDLQYEDGADITGNHTANDTNNVNGVSANTVATGGVRAYNSINSYNRYTQWLTSGELASGSNPDTGVIIDSAGIRGYHSGTKMFELDDSDGNAYFRGNIYAVNGTFTGNINSSATITGGTIQTATSGQRVIISGTNNHIQFYNSDGDDAGYLYGHTYTDINGNTNTSINVSGTFGAYGQIGCLGGFLTTGNSWFENNDDNNSTLKIENKGSGASIEAYGDNDTAVIYASNSSTGYSIYGAGYVGGDNLYFDNYLATAYGYLYSSSDGHLHWHNSVDDSSTQIA